jgi:hypothetical protein
MLLNKIPVLDKGYVALLDSCNNSTKLKDINDEFFSGKALSLEELGTMTVVMRCPLFVQLALSKFSFKILNAANDLETEAYLPHAGEVGSPERGTSAIISDDIARTTAALLINPKSYQADGCGRFISQVITPINVYTTLIVHGTYNEWYKYTQQRNLPGPMRSYTDAIKQILTCEWK